VANLRSAFGYLDGSIPKPSLTPQNVPLPASPTTATTATVPTTTSTTTTLLETPWESTTPSLAKWKVRDAWALGLLVYNTIDPIGLGINISGNAADAWKLYIDNYEVASEIAIINADRDLRNMLYNDGDDFQDFINCMRTKWSNATALGAPIDDRTFRTIVLSALPQSWDPIVTTLYKTQTSRDAINQLMTHEARISRDRVMNTRTSTSTLQASTGRQFRSRFKSNLTCTNPNCKRIGHTIEDCYWPGGGKQGQFPPNFGKRGGTKPVQQTSANAADTRNASTSTEPKVFALAAITEVDKVPSPAITPIPNTPPNTATTTSRTYSDAVCQRGMVKVEEKPVVANQEDTLLNVPESHAMFNSKPIITLLDSGASNHCFTEMELFTTYRQVDPPRTGHSAGKDSTFTIEGSGTVELSMEDQGAITKVLLANLLHTPHLRSNLISVSKLVSKGASVSFEGERAIVRNAQGLKVFSAIRMNGLYIVNVTHRSAAHTAQVGKGSIPYEIWHRHLGHVPVNVISQMEKGDLVDGLNASGEARLKALCEDCLFGKQTAHPFNNTITRETSVLECVYVDIWGPANVQSAGGAKYFMLCMDGASSFRKVFFIASKTAEVTLQIFREFYVESERQTGKKLKWV
jgi:hypothetical protein